MQIRSYLKIKKLMYFEKRKDYKKSKLKFVVFSNEIKCLQAFITV